MSSRSLSRAGRAAVALASPRGAPVVRAARAQAGNEGGGGDAPVDPNFPEGFVNAITVALTNSPINEGKKWLAKQQAGPYDAPAWAAKVRGEVDAAPVLVYSWTTCPFCKKAKAILEEANAGVGAPITVLELDTMGQDGKVYRAALSELTGRTSMPQIFVGKEFVGGCNDGPGVATLAREGKLEPMLRAAAASIKA